jgi:O-antigen/teichoic acid export membrane protein
MSDPPEPPSAPPKSQRSPLFRIVRNAGSILLGDAGGQILTGVCIALAAVKLEPAGFGRLAEAQAFVDPFEAVAGFGLQQVAITIAAKRGDADGAVRGSVFGIQMMLTLFSIAIIIPAALLLGRGNLLPIIVVLCVGLLIVPVTTVAQLSFHFHQTMHRLIVVPFLASVARFAGTIAAVRRLNIPVGHQLATLAGVLVQSVLSVFAMRRWYPAKLHFDRKLALMFLAIAWPYGMHEILVMVWARGAYFLLHSAGPTVQGEFAAADRLLKPVFGIASAVWSSTLPTIATLAAKHDYATLRRSYLQAMRRIAQIIIPVMALGWVFASWLLQRVVPEYAGAVMPFRVLSIAASFAVINQLTTTYTVALGKFRIILAQSTFNALMYLALAPQLVPRWQATGAAASNAILEGINMIGQIYVLLYLLRAGEKAHPKPS